MHASRKGMIAAGWLAEWESFFLFTGHKSDQRLHLQECHIMLFRGG